MSPFQRPHPLRHPHTGGGGLLPYQLGVDERGKLAQDQFTAVLGAQVLPFRVADGGEFPAHFELQVPAPNLRSIHPGHHIREQPLRAGTILCGNARDGQERRQGGRHHIRQFHGPSPCIHSWNVT